MEYAGTCAKSKVLAAHHRLVAVSQFAVIPNTVVAVLSFGAARDGQVLRLPKVFLIDAAPRDAITNDQ